jgi:hypothetical protein
MIRRGSVGFTGVKGTTTSSFFFFAVFGAGWGADVGTFET